MNRRTAGQAEWLRLLRPSTFRARITLVMTLLALIILALVDAAVYAGRYRMLQNNLDAILLNIAREQTGFFLEELGNDSNPANASAAKPLALQLPSGTAYETYVQIEDRTGRILAHTSNLEHLPRLRVRQGTRAQAETDGPVFEDIGPGAEPMRCLCYPFVGAGERPLLALIAVSEEPMVSSLRSLTMLLSGSLVFGGLAFALASSRLSLRLTRPLEQIAAVARNVEETNLYARLPEVSPDKELRDVTEVLNEMLERLEIAFAQQQALVAEQQALVLAQQRFVADASHELRSPLSNLYGTVEVALRRPRAPEDYRDTLAIALAEIQRLSRLVEDLLTLSRADAGQFSLNRQACDLGAIACDSMQAHAARAEQNGVMLQLFKAEQTPVYGDRDRLRQVVDNLLDNALKYAPPKTAVEITVERDGQECRLNARDYGPGIAPEDAAQIFNRFYRTDLSRARASGGAGLGLAIAQAIVHAHGGELAVESAPGVGTTFRLSLPAAGEQADDLLGDQHEE